MHADAIKVIQNIEAQYDTNKLLYRGVSYWPLCRLRLWVALMRATVLAKKAGDPAGVANAPPSWPNVGQVNAELFGPQEIGLHRTHPKGGSDPIGDESLNPRSLFFVRPEEYSDKIQGAAYAKIIDSVFDRARALYQATKIEVADPRTMNFTRHFPSLFLHVEQASRGVNFDPPGNLEHFPALELTLEKLGAGIKLDSAELTASMGAIFHHARIFEKVLKQLNPTALFMSVYYHNIGMAWLLACRRMGVKSIDLQHGRLGPYHGAYTQFTAAPADGYHLVPDRIWCWGEQTKHDIEVDKNPQCTRHGGTVGGNAWLHKWRYGDTAGLEPPEVSVFANWFPDKRKILVSLQPLESPVNAVLLEAMRQSPADWIWLMRLHPLRRHTAPAIAELLQNAGIKNFEIERSTIFPLFSLLKITDHHVTVFSSVAIEAAAFGVRTSLIGAEGRDIFVVQIDKKICHYTPTTTSLIDHITATLNESRPQIADGFMNMNEGVVDQALKPLLEFN
jgi:hypothetical protein